MRLVIILVAALASVGYGQLPPGCRNLHDEVLSSVDPTSIFPENRELEDVAPPRRLGSFRQSKAFPTQSFATNQAKAGGEPPIKTEPYTAFLSNEGVAYDASSLDRWSDPSRSDEMLQQTPSEEGAPWNKLTSLGTNMRQVAIGPDGNKFGGTYTGRSGIRVSIKESADPIWEDFTENSANFVFTDANGGTMEASIVRGAPLATHIISNANPILTPYCLASVNGQAASYPCPMEGGYVDGGEGFLSGSCSDGELHITLYTTKAVDVSLVQWAAAPRSSWPSGMNTCGSECVAQPDGKRVDIYIPNAAGEMAFAVNVIGKFILPPDWTNDPETATCSLADPRSNPRPDPRPSPRTSCGENFCQTPQCEFDGATNSFELLIELDAPVTGLSDIQVASANSADWQGGSFPPMLTCTPQICDISPDLTTITWTGTFTSASVAYAVNVVGRMVQPPNWTMEPFRYTCGDDLPTDAPTGEPGPTTAPPGNPDAPDPAYCAATPEVVTCTSPFCQYAFCQAAAANPGFQDVKIIVKLQQPLAGGIGDVQFAVSNSWNWPVGMESCTSEYCSVNEEGTELTYCRQMPEGGVSFAVNVIGRFIRPTFDWQQAPYMYQCGGSGTALGSGRKFVLELNEPGTELPEQTRKYVAYFSSDVSASLDASGLSFTPLAGGNYNGIVQLGYLGAGPRGDTSGNDFYEPYQGVFPYKSDLQFCADEDTGYINFDWNKYDVNGPTTSGDLLMIAYPHHWPLLEKHGELVDTPFGFKGFVGDNWLLEEELPQASMEPLQDAVDDVMDDPEQLADIIAALGRDVAGAVIDETCDSGGSYWAGKDIAMAARAASISRAFGTDHYQQLDGPIQRCLDRWLRVDDTLSPANQFWYDSVMGGVWSRCVPDGQPIEPHANFGFPIFADHHFHLGYWVYAAGYLAKHDPQWAEARRERLLLLARDIGNPSPLDAWFPVVRHKDWFLGLSWATGAEGGSRQQESSTEGINAYHGLAALGEALGDPLLQATGQITLATEIRSVREYFHVRQHNRARFPPYIQEYGAIGMFTDEIYSYTLNWPCAPNWFPMRHACLIGIQVIPIISVSGLYMDAEWADAVRTVCGWSVDPWSAPGAEFVDPDILEPVREGWGAFCATASAPYSPELAAAAADMVRGVGPAGLVSGSGEASTLLFIYARS